MFDTPLSRLEELEKMINRVAINKIQKKQITLLPILQNYMTY